MISPSSAEYPATLRTVLSFSLLILLLILLFPLETPLARITEQPDQPLQFTAGGHVLGFQPDGIYVAGGDHLLHVSPPWSIRGIRSLTFWFPGEIR